MGTIEKETLSGERQSAGVDPFESQHLTGAAHDLAKARESAAAVAQRASSIAAAVSEVDGVAAAIENVATFVTTRAVPCARSASES